ncbi:MAG: Uma2 family endonuclease [Armatimonadetes bacterium]|nr:Uma2 family endonuclease [Armatimonadota bacterium]
MSLARNPEQWTPEAYLAFERKSDAKHELIDGRLVAMSGASRAHAALAAKLSGILYQRLRGCGCQAFSSDLRVRAGEPDQYTYPDLSVVCGEVLLEDDQGDTLLNPTMLVEILSPSTQAYDRGAKFRRYQGIAALRDYILVSQDQPLVEVFSRADGGRWLYASAEGLASMIEAPSLGCTIELAELYEGIAFDAAAGTSEATGAARPT